MTCCLNIYGLMRHTMGGEGRLGAESWQMLERKEHIPSILRYVTCRWGAGQSQQLTFTGHLLCAVPVSDFILFHHHSIPQRMGQLIMLCYRWETKAQGNTCR